MSAGRTEETVTLTIAVRLRYDADREGSRDALVAHVVETLSRWGGCWGSSVDHGSFAAEIVGTPQAAK